MMSHGPTLVFVPGAWHKAACFDKVVKLLQHEHGLNCIALSLPSTAGDPTSTFKDDVDTVRNTVVSELREGRDVIVVAHSYGTMVGSSAIKDLTPPPRLGHASNGDRKSRPKSGFVTALVIIAAGFPLTGVAFMDLLLGKPPPFWRVNKETGFADLVDDPRELFYHDLPRDEADYWTSQLGTQNLKAFFEGGEHVYAGWRDLPTWFIGTTEDRGLPVVFQRMFVGMARGHGGVVHHVEVKSSHSPFLSVPGDVTAILYDVVTAVGEPPASRNGEDDDRKGRNRSKPNHATPATALTDPTTWLKYGVPLALGRVLGWTMWSITGIRRVWRGK